MRSNYCFYSSTQISLFLEVLSQLWIRVLEVVDMFSWLFVLSWSYFSPQCYDKCPLTIPIPTFATFFPSIASIHTIVELLSECYLCKTTLYSSLKFSWGMYLKCPYPSLSYLLWQSHHNTTNTASLYTMPHVPPTPFSILSAMGNPNCQSARPSLFFFFFFWCRSIYVVFLKKKIVGFWIMIWIWNWLYVFLALACGCWFFVHLVPFALYGWLACLSFQPTFFLPPSLLPKFSAYHLCYPFSLLPFVFCLPCCLFFPATYSFLFYIFIWKNECFVYVNFITLD